MNGLPDPAVHVDLRHVTSLASTTTTTTSMNGDVEGIIACGGWVFIAASRQCILVLRSSALL